MAWEPLGWKALAFAEIEPFPRAVLAHHYPDTPLYGDFTKLREHDWIVDADVLVGGTPCQAFSVAGLRDSLQDERGNLSLEFIRLANAIDDLRRDAGREPAWIVWENVPGIFSVSDNAFGAFLGGLVGSDEPIVPRGRWTDAGVVAGPQRVAAWRVLDAQHFGLAQRRRRIFVLALGGPGRWRCADALLPLIDSLQGHSAPGRETGPSVAALTANGVGTCGADDNQGQAGHLIAFGGNDTRGPIDVSTALNAHGGPMGRMDFERETFIASTLRARDMTRGVDSDCTDTLIAHTLRGEGFDASEDGTGRGTPLVPVTFSIMPQNSGKDFKAREIDVAQPLMADRPTRGNQGGDYVVPVAFRTTGNDGAYETGDAVGALTTSSDPNAQIIAFSSKDHGADAEENLAPTLRAGNHNNSHANGGVMPAVAFALRGREGGSMPEVGGDLSNAIRTPGGGASVPMAAIGVTIHGTDKTINTASMTDIAGAIRTKPPGSIENSRTTAALHGSAVRRLTPKECERLQGFPDNYTDVPFRGKPAADGPRYKALGNSMAVPCMAYIGQRIAQVIKPK